MPRYYLVFFKVIFVFSFAALIAAYALEYIWDIKPCKLCKYERIPHFFLLLFSTLGIILPRMQRAFGLLIVITSLSGVLLSFFHTGMEKSWFKYASSCSTSSLANNDSLEAFKEQIMQKDLIPCDVAHYEFLWISIAGWNFILNLVILVFATIFTFSLLREVNYDKN